MPSARLSHHLAPTVCEIVNSEFLFVFVFLISNISTFFEPLSKSVPPTVCLHQPVVTRTDVSASMHRLLQIYSLPLCFFKKKPGYGFFFLAGLSVNLVFEQLLLCC